MTYNVFGGTLNLTQLQLHEMCNYACLWESYKTRTLASVSLSGSSAVAYKEPRIFIVS